MEYTQPENRQKIGEAQVREAELILRKYRSGKANLEKRIVESQKWWKLRNASVEAPKGGPGDIKAPLGLAMECDFGQAGGRDCSLPDL